MSVFPLNCELDLRRECRTGKMPHGEYGNGKEWKLRPNKNLSSAHPSGAGENQPYTTISNKNGLS